MSDKPTVQPHRLLSLGLANFKAFGPNLQTIPLRPITLIFGPNSSGKSSLLHFLLWMKDVVEKQTLDVYKPSAGGNSVDLGGFRQCCYGADAKAAIHTCMEFELNEKFPGGKSDGQKAQLESVFSTRNPAPDYHEIIRESIAAKAQTILEQLPLESFLSKLSSYEKRLVTECIKEIVTHHPIQRDLDLDVIFSNNESTSDSSARPISDWRKDVSKKMAYYFGEKQRIDIESWLSASSVREEFETDREFQNEPPHLITTVEELIEGLQSVACGAFDELSFNHPESPYGNPRLIRFVLSTTGHPLIVAERRNAGDLVLGTFDLDHFLDFIGIGSHPHRELWKRFLRLERQSLVFTQDSFCEWLPGKLIYDSRYLRNRGVLEVENTTGLSLESSMNSLCDLINNFLGACGELAQKACGPIQYLGPLRAYPSRQITLSDLPREWDAGGLTAWRSLFFNEKLRSQVNDWLKKPELRTQYEILADHRVSLNGVLKSVRYQFRSEIGILNSETDAAKTLSYFRDSGEHDDKAQNPLDGWDNKAALKKIEECVISQNTSESTGTIILRDTRTQAHVSSRDIGVGISQLLPVLVQAMGAQNELLAIEQPELHLHPALQAELGDVFIESAMTRGNRFVLETHSEHLILRVMRRIRETTHGKLPDGLPPLRKEDVAVLYVEQTPEGSIVREMPLNDRGELVKAWPGGFFEEGFKEMFDS